MPHQICKTIYNFDELSDAAIVRAREWYREGGLEYEWWDDTFADAKICLAFLGFEITNIFFSGFASQGDGACFEGRWRAVDVKTVKAMKKHAPQDITLHVLASTFRKLSKSYPGAAFSVKHHGHYSHEFCTAFTFDDEGLPDYVKDGPEDQLTDAARDAMCWIYRQLEQEYDYLTSDEQVDETIRANEYEFTEDGRRAR